MMSFKLKNNETGKLTCKIVLELEIKLLLTKYKNQQFSKNKKIKNTNTLN